MTADDPRDAVKDTAAAARDAAERGTEAAGRAASSASDKIDAAATQASQTAGAAYEKMKEGVSGLREQMPGSASDAVDAGRRAYAQGSDRLGRQVARQPIEALLLAGAIGYLVGWAANRS